MSKFKKIAAVAAAALTISTLSMGVFASTQDTRSTINYAKFDNYVLPDRGVTVDTDAIRKTDILDYAVVYFEEGGVSDDTPVYYCVKDEDKNTVSEVSGVAKELGRCESKYKSGKGINGDYYILRLNAGYYGLTVSGRWAP